MTSGREVITRFIAELARAVGTQLETSASTRAAELQDTDGFVLTLAAGQGGRGQLQAFFSNRSVLALTPAQGPASTPDEIDVATRLRRLCAQAAAMVDRRADGCTLAVASVERIDRWEAPPDATVVEIVLSGYEEPVQVAIGGAIVHAEMKNAVAKSQTLDVILDIDLPLVVRFGRTDLPLRTLTTLGPGSVIDLGRSPDELVEVMISGRVVARGEVVTVGGNYGVRVRDVVSPAERARSLEAELA
jgi:flagellar motor switch protein FliN/FliY